MDTRILSNLVRLALKEDIGLGDYTSLACIDTTSTSETSLKVKQNAVIAGLFVAKEIFNAIDPSISVTFFCEDGAKLATNDPVLNAQGSTRSLLAAERLVLNVMQRMSGIATLTHQMVQSIEPFACKILDTRKTTPNCRLLEKMAVKIGGGYNHRFGLDDMILIKDNHIAANGCIKTTVERAILYRKNHHFSIPIVVEVANEKQLLAIKGMQGIERILLDNFSPKHLTKLLQINDHFFITEASGGINQENIKDYASTGVDFLSVGFITHHANSIDMSLKIIEQTQTL